MSATRFRRIARLERLADSISNGNRELKKSGNAFWVEQLRTQPFLPF